MVSLILLPVTELPNGDTTPVIGLKPDNWVRNAYCAPVEIYPLGSPTTCKVALRINALSLYCCTSSLL